MNLKDQIPTKQVGQSLGYGMPVAIIIGWSLETWMGIDVPPGVEGAMGVLVSGVIAWAIGPDRNKDA